MGSISTIGLSAGLAMAAQGLAVQRAAVEISGNNISNVNTPNYSRQRVNMNTDVAVNTSIGSQGLGAIISGIEQLRDALLDGQIPTNISRENYLDQKSILLNQITSNIGQTVDNIESLAGSTVTTITDGLTEVLDGFFNAFESLSGNPTSQVLRQQVLLSAEAVARKLNTISSNLTTLQSQLISQVSQNVDDINSDLANIASLNQQIYSTEIGAERKANNLRDTRQLAIEELSKRVDLWFQEEANTTVTVRLGSSTGTLLVDRFYSGNTGQARTYKLTAVNNPTAPGETIKYELQGWTGGVAETALNRVAIANQPSKGTIAAQIEVVNDTIGDATKGLVLDYNNIASQFGTLVNTQHALGYNLKNSPLYNCLGGRALPGDPDQLLYDVIATAATIRLNPTIAADPLRIAATLITAPDTPPQPNNGLNALAISRLRNTPVAALTNQTVSQYYLTSISNLGNDLRANDSQLSTQKIVNQQLNEQRDSVMGVSIDEEMTNLIRYQYSYQANAKMISILDQMFATLLMTKQ